MTELLFSVLNLVGYSLLIISYIPQYVHIYRVKRTEQINLLWPGITAVAITLMEPLALSGGLIEYAIGNTAGLIACLLLIAQIVFYRRNPLPASKPLSTVNQK